MNLKKRRTECGCPDVEEVVGKTSWNEGSAARSRVTHFRCLGKTPVNLIDRRWVFGYWIRTVWVDGDGAVIDGGKGCVLSVIVQSDGS
jgi:hypothetical protein